MCCKLNDSFELWRCAEDEGDAWRASRWMLPSQLGRKFQLRMGQGLAGRPRKSLN